MYLALLWGGWVKSPLRVRGGRLWTTAICLLLGTAAMLPQMTLGTVSIHPGYLLLTAGVVAVQRTEHPLRLLLYTAAAGLAGWKLTDWFPLFGEPAVLYELPAMLLCLTYSGDRGGKRLLLTLTPLMVLLCAALGDRFLFGYAVWRLGNADALSAAVLGRIFGEMIAAVSVKSAGEMPAAWAFWRSGPKENS